ncbi:MAG: DUF2236 domain-containing protein [Acidimicrobiaceae bacterium]|nr:DUF2236 domain-containing protein [Acidimicrobiaceae bacterium]
MQLSRLAVGHGVAESTVESGSLHRHPLKRTRTTLSYIMIALFGSDHERDVMRREVNRQHRPVHSSPGGHVVYDAFDPQLQLWVAACMYRGVEDAARILYASRAEAILDEFYPHSARFATTLQVPPERWPRDRAAFELYWRDALTEVAMDDVTRRFLLGIASLDFLPMGLGHVFGPIHRFVTTGFLADRFREELGLTWGPRRERIFRSLCALEVRLNRIAPTLIREFPWNMYLWEVRRRIRLGRPIV